MARVVRDTMGLDDAVNIENIQVYIDDLLYVFLYMQWTLPPRLKKGKPR